MNSGLKLARFVKPYWRWAALAPLLMMLEVAMDLLQPRMVQRIVDDGIARLDLNVVIQTGLLMVLLAVVGAPGGIFNGFFAEKTALAFAADLREALFRKVQTFSFRNLDDLDTGQLITRLTNDVTQLQEAIVMILRMLVRAPLLLVGSLIMAVITSPQLAFLPLVLIPIVLVAVVLIVRKATPLFTKVQERLDALNEVMQENLAGVRVVKAFVRGLHEIKRFGVANNNLTDQTVGAARTVAIIPAFMMLIMNLGDCQRVMVRRPPGDRGGHARRPDHRLCQLPDHHPVLAGDGQPVDHPDGARRGFRQTHRCRARHRSRCAEPAQCQAHPGGQGPGDL